MFSSAQLRQFDKIKVLLHDPVGKTDVATKVDSDGDYILTPWALCGEIVQQVKQAAGDLSNKKVLVVDTIEFIPVLLAFGVNKRNITYVAPYVFKGSIARSLGVNVVQDSLLTWKTNMKFDVVIGNPPYNNDSGTSEKPWVRFVNVSIESLLKDGCHAAFVTPNSWYHRGDGQRTKIVSNLLKKYNLVYADIRKSSYFTVGDDIGWWIVTKKPNSNTPVYMTDSGKVTERISSIEDCIFDKIIGAQFRKVRDSYAKATFTQADSTASVISSGKVTEQPTLINKFRVYWSSSKRELYTSEDYVNKCWKLIYSRSGYFFKDGLESEYLPVSDIIAVGALSDGIKVNNREEGENLRKLFLSKIYKLYIVKRKQNGFNDHIRKLPILDLARTWTDQELYVQFGLTQEEIDYIEATVK